MLDCLVIGGGPAGLTAGLYLGRFLRKAAVIDAGSSRAALIPVSHNYPGFSHGVSGRDFLDTLRAQVRQYGVELMRGEVTRIDRKGERGFTAVAGNHEFQARTIILATGIVDEKPAVPGISELVYDGVVRFCPVCDGYETIGKTVAIVGPCSRIYPKALFLRTYSRKLILLPTDDNYLCRPDDRSALQGLGLTLPSSRLAGLKISERGVEAHLEDGTRHEADILYPAMGAQVRTSLVEGFGIVGETGCIATDAHQQTCVPGLYAIGDITLDLSQIAVATGQAAIAATAVHNALPLNCA